MGSLAYRDDLFLIHVDKRTSRSVFREMASGVAGHNVIFLARHSFAYRSFDHVRASLKGLNYLREHGIQFGHVVLLTGQDYPIKSPAFIHRYLEYDPSLSFMQSFALPNLGWQEGGIARLRRAHFFVAGRVFGVNRRCLAPSLHVEIPGGLRPYGGSSYWILTREHVNYVADFVVQHPSVSDFFRRADVSDELFFQTILLNSPLATQVINDDLRHVDWSATRERPAILDCSDIEALRGSSDLFARKFDYDHAPDVVRRIDAELLGPAP